MKYKRRPDINSLMRVRIAVQAYLGLGVYGEITRLANSYNVCRLFVYQLLWEMLDLFQTEPKGIDAKNGQQKELDRQILLLRMEGKCSLEAISEILKQQGFSIHSIGYISQRILALAQSVPTLQASESKIVFFIADEIFANGQPILITIDPKSLAILKIELASRRDAATWKQHWEALAAAGYIDNKIVVSDLGTGLVKGCVLLGITHHPDLFHLLQPIAVFVSRFEHKAYAAISEEDERQKVFDNAKTERVLNEKLALYEKAEANARQAIELYDNFYYLWQQLKQAFDLFDVEGNFKDPHKNWEEVCAILELIKKLNCEKLNIELAGFERALVAYWNYFYRAQTIHQQLLESYSQEIVTLVCLAWQYLRHAINSRNYQQQLYFKQEAQHYLDWAESINPEEFTQIKVKIFDALDSNIRSSSLVENINSSLRRLLVNCRGQVTQALLDLFAYVHNYRPFLRGTRKGLAPMEILTGNRLETSWLDSLLEAVY